jgi:hypothetical protein
VVPSAIEQAVAPDASIACLSSNFHASMLGWLSLAAGEQQRWVAYVRSLHTKRCSIGTSVRLVLCCCGNRHGRSDIHHLSKGIRVLWACGSSLQEGQSLEVPVLVWYTDSVRRFPLRRVCLWISYLMLSLSTLGATQQSLAADGAVTCFSSSLFHSA